MNKENQNIYEGMYIISATLSEDARQKAVDKLVSSITAKKGSVENQIDWGRRRLAYEINGHREGHYMIIYFKADPSIIDELWKEYHLNEDLIRFMTKRTDHIMEKIEFKEMEEVI